MNALKIFPGLLLQLDRGAKVLATVMALLLLLSHSTARADPPSRVARVADLSGEAWMFDADDKAWVPVSRNQTVSEGDRLRTERNSRVSLRIGSTSMWLDERSDVEFTRLDDDRVELQLDKGEVGLRLRNQQSAGETSVRSREGRFSFEREGVYRIDQLDRGSKGYTWFGQMRFESRSADAPPVWLSSNEQAEFWWANGARAERMPLMRDEFGDWLLSQSRSEGEPQAYRYVSPEMTGADDLDGHGRWDQSNEYGAIWIPYQVAPDWAPYRYGHWAWTQHWGWSWVDDAPWGFAPFHYGRWVHYGGRWCWAPGRYIARPVYAPALVAWVGGPSVSVGIHIGSGPRPAPPRVGWVPLAPREHYAPSYRHSPDYDNRINAHFNPVTGPKPPGGEPRNHAVPGAISYLPEPSREQGRGQGNVPRPMPAPDLARGPVRTLPQAPDRHELPVTPPRQVVVAPPALPVPPGTPAAPVQAGRPGMDFGRTPVPVPNAQAVPPVPGVHPVPPADAERPRDRWADERNIERNNERNNERNRDRFNERNTDRANEQARPPRVTVDAPVSERPRVDRMPERPRGQDAGPVRPAAEPVMPTQATPRPPAARSEDNKGPGPQRSRDDGPRRRDGSRDPAGDR